MVHHRQQAAVGVSSRSVAVRQCLSACGSSCLRHLGAWVWCIWRCMRRRLGWWRGGSSSWQQWWNQVGCLQQQKQHRIVVWGGMCGPVLGHTVDLLSCTMRFAACLFVCNCALSLMYGSACVSPGSLWLLLELCNVHHACLLL
jgi:hypothetical protein